MNDDAAVRDDAGILDVDGGQTDAGVPDAGVLDAGPTDAGRDDGGSSDAGMPGARVAIDCSRQDAAVDLACTGLYSDWVTLTTSSDLTEYVPGFALWSDGAAKRRWAQFPTGTQIDSSNPLEWHFPVGTRLWKEFSINGVRVETRLLFKRSASTWEFSTFRWSDDETRAVKLTRGERNVRDSGYEIPSVADCLECHGLTGDVPLGLDPVLVSAPSARGLTADTLNTRGLLTVSLDAGSLQVPGTAVEQAALGYLHVNCGVSCHRANGSYVSGAYYRLEPGELATVQDTDLFKTAVNVRTVGFLIPGVPANESMRLTSGGDAQGPAKSAIFVRMNSRVSGTQMPPLLTHRVDPNGTMAVEQWILSMTSDAGYPAAPNSVLTDAGASDAGEVDGG